MPSSTVPSRRHASLALVAILAASAAGADDRKAASGRWSLEAGQSSVYDTNIDHDTPARADYGVIFMGAAGWQNRVARPSLALRYEAALHRYADSPKWNRLSQRGEAAFEKRLFKRWTSETRGEVSLKGSSEDRELSNQYTLLQQVDFRVVRGLGLRAYGLARLKRYPVPDQDRDATNSYAGAALRARLGAARVELGSRYEDNAARSERRDYQRWVHAADLATPLGRHDALDLELKLYDQQYPSRLVGHGPAKGRARLDRRLVGSAAWAHHFREDLGFEVAYKHERRTSNEPDKGFNAQEVALSFLYRFDRPRYQPPEPPSR